MATVINPTSLTYVTATYAARTLGISRFKVSSLAMRGEIRVHFAPGSSPRYCLEDVERLVEQSKQSG